MTDGPLTVLDVLSMPPLAGPWSSLPELWNAYGVERAAGRSPFASAVRVAARGDRLGHAFAVGYPAALEHMLPGVRLPCALCVTEAGGNGPRAIQTTLSPDGEGFRLSGEKTFVTFGNLAETLVIATRVGDKADGRPDLAIVRVPSDRDGIAVEELPATPFVPEIGHARLSLRGVEVLQGERLPGDGYLRYVKPFRTIEDVHVVGATLGYVVGWARRLPVVPELVAELSADLIALDRLCSAPPLDPRAHIALHGVYERVHTALRSDAFGALLQASSDDERDRWERDRRLLSVAGQAREARFASANEALQAASAPSSSGA